MDVDARRAGPFILVAVIATVIVLAVANGLGRSGEDPGPSPSASRAEVSASPSVTVSASPSASLGPSPSASASASPSPTPAPPTPSPTAAACAVTSEEGQLPTDRVVSVEVSTSPTVDFVTFVFDEGSLTPAGPPRGELSAAEPPFTFGPSGLPIDLQGTHAAQVVMRGMSLYNDVGEPTFTGDPDIVVDYPALRQVIMFDESEGVAGWYIGYEGNGCVELVRDGNDIVVTIANS